MKATIVLLFSFTMLIGSAPSGQAQEERPVLDRFLVPIVIDGESPGAFGSRWVTRLVIHNASNDTVNVTQAFGCSLATCPNQAVPPHTTVFDLPNGFVLDDGVTGTRSGTGAFVHVRRLYRDSMSFNLRVQDLSRQALTRGTELPLVHESEAFLKTLQLINVPTDARFRVAIRFYDFEPGNTDRHVRMRVYSGTNQPLAETTVALVPNLRLLNYLPGYAQFVDLVGAFPQVAASETVRVEITPLSEGLRFWAFASVTNNETQHVTTITPQGASPRTTGLFE